MGNGLDVLELVVPQHGLGPALHRAAAEAGGELFGEALVIRPGDELQLRAAVEVRALELLTFHPRHGGILPDSNPGGPRRYVLGFESIRADPELRRRRTASPGGELLLDDEVPPRAGAAPGEVLGPRRRSARAVEEDVAPRAV